MNRDGEGETRKSKLGKSNSHLRQRGEEDKGEEKSAWGGWALRKTKGVSRTGKTVSGGTRIGCVTNTGL